MSGGPLQGFTVVEIAQNVAGPLCGRLLLEMGADVIKVEPPEGDALRHLRGHDGHDGPQFVIYNAGKRSRVIDLGGSDAPAKLAEIFTGADAVIIALKPPDIERFGLSPDAIAAVNPTAVVATISGLGPQGPQGHEGGYDVLVQALAGLAFIGARTEGDALASIRPAYNDVGTAVFTALGIVAALLRREREGVADTVETSLLATALTFATPLVSEGPDHAAIAATITELVNDPAFAEQSVDEQRQQWEGVAQPGSAAVLRYFKHHRSADGLIALGAISPSLQRRLSTLMVTAGFDPGDVAGYFAAHRSAEVLQTLRAAGIPCAALNRPDQVLRDPQVLANGYVRTIVDASDRPYRIPTRSIVFSSSDPLRGNSLPPHRAPALGES